MLVVKAAQFVESLPLPWSHQQNIGDVKRTQASTPGPRTRSTRPRTQAWWHTVQYRRTLTSYSMQNILARVVVGAAWTSSSLIILRDLYWLPVGRRIIDKLRLTTWKTLHIIDKLRLTTWKTLHISQPPYLSELISHYLEYLPSRSLRSSNLLTRPPGITSYFSPRAFSVSAPSTWNSTCTHSFYRHFIHL